LLDIITDFRDSLRGGPEEVFPAQETKLGVAMQQEISMVYLNERIPFPRYFTPSDLRSLVGKRYCAAGDLIVPEKAGQRGGGESHETGNQHNLIQYDPAVKGDRHGNHGFGEAIFAVKT
jgi:hypothetical protein